MVGSSVGVTEPNTSAIVIARRDQCRRRAAEGEWEEGPLTGGSPCRLSILRNANVAYMSLLLIYGHVACWI